MWIRLIYIAFGGAIGAVFRYGVSGFSHKILGVAFPWGTLAVNLIGSFVIGFLWGIREKTIMPSDFKSFIFIGVLGSFTTFSSFSLETINLFRNGEIKFALINILATNIFGISLAILGFLLSQYIFVTIARR